MTADQRHDLELLTHALPLPQSELVWAALHEVDRARAEAETFERVLRGELAITLRDGTVVDLRKQR